MVACFGKYSLIRWQKTQSQALGRVMCALLTVHGIICTYNWIADYTIVMLVHKIT